MTLVGALGPLFESDNPKYAKLGKSDKNWSRYMKGASGRFAEYACRGRQAVVLTNPPPRIYGKRVNSTFRIVEEPILRGAIGGPGTLRIDYAHPTVAGATHFLYQTWPENRSNDWFTFFKDILRKEMGQSAVGCIEASGGKGVDEPEQQKPSAKEGLKHCPMGMAQSKAQTEKKSKRQKTEDELKKAQEKKQVKRQKVEAEQERTRKKKEAKRRRTEDEQSKARTKKEAKRQKADDERRKVQEKREAKQRKAQEELRKKLERKEAKRKRVEGECKNSSGKQAIKRLKVEEEQRQTQERKEAKRKRVEEEQQKILRKKAQKKKLEDEQRQAREKKEARRRRAEKLQRKAQERKETTQQRMQEGQRKAQEKKVVEGQQSQATNIGRETKDLEKNREAKSRKENFLFGPRGLLPRCQTGQVTTQPVTVIWKPSSPMAGSSEASSSFRDRYTLGFMVFSALKYEVDMRI